MAVKDISTIITGWYGCYWHSRMKRIDPTHATLLSSNLGIWTRNENNQWMVLFLKRGGRGKVTLTSLHMNLIVCFSAIQLPVCPSPRPSLSNHESQKKYLLFTARVCDTKIKRGTRIRQPPANEHMEHMCQRITCSILHMAAN